MNYLTFPLSKKHQRSGFCCGKNSLDHYFQKQVNQDIKRKLCACFVLVGESNRVKGFYTLSNGSIPREIVPESIRKKMPGSYTGLPTTLLGRLAIDKDHARQGLGEKLLIDALKRCYEASSKVGSMAVIVDPLDEEATSFYEKYGFIKLPDSGRMFLPMKTIQQLFASP